MGEKKILTEEMTERKLTEARLRREFLTYEELRTQIVDWSKDTVKRRIEHDGFPAVKDGNSYLFPRAKVLLWFAKREVQI